MLGRGLIMWMLAPAVALHYKVVALRPRGYLPPPDAIRNIRPSLPQARGALTLTLSAKERRAAVPYAAMVLLAATAFVAARPASASPPRRARRIHGGARSGFLALPLRPKARTRRQHIICSETSSLEAIFLRALMLQRAGDKDGALDNYQIFLAAAKENEAPPDTYAEVLVNIGTIYAMRSDPVRAKQHFEEALQYRDIGSARVNLAVLLLQQVSAAAKSGALQRQEELVKEAMMHCQRTVALQDDPNAVASANRLLADIKKNTRSV